MPNPFAKGHRAELTFRGVDHHGVVEKVTADSVVLRLDDGGLTVPQPYGRIRPSTRPLPETGFNRPWAKGERVEFQFETQPGVRETVHGTLVTVAPKAKIIGDGGTTEYTIALGSLSLSTGPVPRHPEDPIDAWGVTAYKSVKGMSEETTAFTAKITLRGKAVIQASNDGRGGCNRHAALPGAPRGIVDAFEAQAKDWFVRNRVPEVSEASDLFVDWYVNRRPYAVTGPEFVKEYGLMLEDLGHQLLSVDRNAALRAMEDEEDVTPGPRP